jgi:hypothetical protein
MQKFVFRLFILLGLASKLKFGITLEFGKRYGMRVFELFWISEE